MQRLNAWKVIPVEEKMENYKYLNHMQSNLNFLKISIKIPM